MSSKQNTTSSQQTNQNQQYQNAQNNVYNPQSLSTYQSLLSGGSNFLQNILQNPMQAGYGNQLLRQYMTGANQQAQGLMSNVANNIQGLGGGVAPGAQQSLMLQAQGMGSNLRANAAQSALLNVLGLQQNAANQAMAYQPLATGQTNAGTGATQGTMNGQQTTTTSGLGTWLPQVLGAAIGGVSSALSGGGTSPLAGGTGSTQSALSGNGYSSIMPNYSPYQPATPGAFALPNGMPSGTAGSGNIFLNNVPTYG